MIKLSTIGSRSKTKKEKLTLNSQLETYQILTNDDKMLILCLSYFITTLHKMIHPQNYLIGI